MSDGQGQATFNELREHRLHGYPGIGRKSASDTGKSRCEGLGTGLCLTHWVRVKSEPKAGISVCKGPASAGVSSKHLSKPESLWSSEWGDPQANWEAFHTAHLEVQGVGSL